jgi:hypothetical protein
MLTWQGNVHAVKSECAIRVTQLTGNHKSAHALLPLAVNWQLERNVDLLPPLGPEPGACSVRHRTLQPALTGPTLGCYDARGEMYGVITDKPWHPSKGYYYLYQAPVVINSFIHPPCHCISQHSNGNLTPLSGLVSALVCPQGLDSLGGWVGGGGVGSSLSLLTITLS